MTVKDCKSSEAPRPVGAIKRGCLAGGNVALWRKRIATIRSAEGARPTGTKMSKDEKVTHFRFDFGGVRLELSGEREFVQEMYKEVMRDVESARESLKEEKGGAGQTGKEAPKKKPSIWLYRASDLIRKIYMISREDVQSSVLGQTLDASELSGVFIDKEIFSEFFPGMDSGHTLWAEFTAEGRELIAEATEGKG